MHKASSTPPRILETTSMFYILSHSVHLPDTAAYVLIIQSLKICDLLTELCSVVCISDPEPYRRGVHQMHDRSVESLRAVFAQRLIRLMFGKIHVL